MANIINLLGDGKPKFNKQVAKSMGFINFPSGNYVISTTSESSDDIPWVANFVSTESNTNSGNSKSPVWSVDGRAFLSAYVRAKGGSGPSSATKIVWSTPRAYGIFLPKLYNYDIGALMTARSTILARENLTVVQWLKKV